MPTLSIKFSIIKCKTDAPSCAWIGCEPHVRLLRFTQRLLQKQLSSTHLKKLLKVIRCQGLGAFPCGDHKIFEDDGDVHVDDNQESDHHVSYEVYHPCNEMFLV